MRIVSLTAAALALSAGIAAAAPFSSVDRNDDGVVTKSEFLRIYGPELDVSSFRFIDENRDGTLDLAEFDAAGRSFGILEENK